jgi:hypothetical protein
MYIFTSIVAKEETSDNPFEGISPNLNEAKFTVNVGSLVVEAVIEGDKISQDISQYCILGRLDTEAVIVPVQDGLATEDLADVIALENGTDNISETE